MYVIIEKKNKRETRYFKRKGLKYLVCVLWYKINKYEIGIIEE